MDKVRTSALNIVLHVISVDDPGVTAFLDLEENRRSFFTELARLMQDTYSQVLCRVRVVPAPGGVGRVREWGGDGGLVYL